MGFSFAATAIIGMEIGANRVDLARKYAKLIKFYSFCCGIIISTILYFASGGISRVYTDIEDIQAVHKGILENVLAIAFTLDTI
jgi:Na+-driven multidrug efflux pump